MVCVCLLPVNLTDVCVLPGKGNVWHTVCGWGGQLTGAESQAPAGVVPCVPSSLQQPWPGEERQRSVSPPTWVFLCHILSPTVSQRVTLGCFLSSIWCPAMWGYIWITGKVLFEWTVRIMNILLTPLLSILHHWTLEWWWWWWCWCWWCSFS